MKDSTKRRSFLGKTLVLLGAMFAIGADKKVLASENRSKTQHASGMGWGGGAVYSPPRGKFKGFMRSDAYKKKHQRK